MIVSPQIDRGYAYRNGECSRCMFFKADDRQEDDPLRRAGHCHRLPPVPVRSPGGISSIWPAVDFDESCGEFQGSPNR